MTAETGSSGLRPAAITRDRRSRSVTMPNVAPCRIRTALAPAAVICRAAARIGASPAHSSGGLRISAATRRCPGSVGGAAVGGARRVTIDRATKASTSGRASSGRTTSAGMR